MAATRGHLREITSGDVDIVLEPLRGRRRYNAIMALRSLVRFAKRRGLTFADPTRHLSGGRGTGRTVLPITAEEIQAAGQAAVTPAQRLAIALAAVHAARPRPSASSPWTTSTCPAGASPSPVTGSASANSPATPCWPGLLPGAEDSDVDGVHGADVVAC